MWELRCKDEFSPASLTPLLQLDWRDMIRIGLADRRALIIFAVIGPLMEQMGDDIESYVEQTLETALVGATQIGVTNGVLIAAAIITMITIIFSLVSFISSDSLAPKIPPAKAPIDNNNA